MAKCPECGKIWFCGNPDEQMGKYYEDDFIHCNKCKCPECRKPGDRMTIDEEYYGKREQKVVEWPKHLFPANWIGNWYGIN